MRHTLMIKYSSCMHACVLNFMVAIAQRRGPALFATYHLLVDPYIRQREVMHRQHVRILSDCSSENRLFLTRFS